MNPRAKKLFSFYKSAPIGVMTEKECPFVKENVDILFPINPLTGNRIDPIQRLFDPLLSENERLSVLARLQTVKGSFSDLSDEELMNIVPSRYGSDIVDRSKWIKYLEVLHAEAVTPVPPAVESTQSATTADASGSEGAE